MSLNIHIEAQKVGAQTSIFDTIQTLTKETKEIINADYPIGAYEDMICYRILDTKEDNPDNTEYVDYLNDHLQDYLSWVKHYQSLGYNICFFVI